ncbi:hypothetical protein EST38_g1415 [Candolleomyces aberdarensis]|uniref:RING-type E3 ubiquitin transferase n=1 Tax=Candolleomyces aberdarensis TaxID=2316362 RepID=A0A4Q2DVU1_9AGAR|nr:hypothetical protein EST38_g1415 [Candolleomyces aberdarensis]
MQNADDKLRKLKELIISYAGLILQEPEMFPQPPRQDLGPPELIKPLLSLSALSTPLFSGPITSPTTLLPTEIEQFLFDLARRFEPDNEIDAILGPVVKGLLSHESLFRTDGLAGADAGWRGVIGGLEALVSVKSIAAMITRLDEWIPMGATAATFERASLMGPLCRLGLFGREWPAISRSYFTEPEKRSREDVDSSFATLRGTLKSLQSSLFKIFDALVRASPASREAVLQYFARVIRLNGRRAGMQVNPDTVASDSFMLNLQSVLLRFAEPFMDVNFSKIDRIDPYFYAHSKRIELGEETRISATSEEATRLPLPNEVPMAFRCLPEYIVEDIVDYFHFAVQTSPDKFELTGKTELLLFVLTFLTSTWYIKNPFLKSKINDVLFLSIWGYGRERLGVLGDLLNTHPVALKHLMPALMHFYIEVEQTGASSQFYDKFNARRNIAYVLKIVWNNSVHRTALNEEAKNVDKFVKFVNLMINDVTYLMDESLGEMAQIHNIQVEMDDQDAWNQQTNQYRQERESTLRSLERHASGYATLGRSTVELLKVFTAETKAPFMMPEIVDRLAAMLDYNLQVLCGPKCQDLKVKEPEKLKFNPKELLGNILQVFLNLSDQEKFVQAVAGDGRSYTKELFDRAADIALRRGIKTQTEIDVLKAFVVRVEEAKASLQAEEDLGEVPDEFLDPLMFTVMKDPVMLPSSRTILDRSTIKSHLLSDSKDPFNRAPLTIEEVIPQLELKAQIDTFLKERREKKMQLDTD